MKQSENNEVKGGEVGEPSSNAKTGAFVDPRQELKAQANAATQALNSQRYQDFKEGAAQMAANIENAAGGAANAIGVVGNAAIKVPGAVARGTVQLAKNTTNYITGDTKINDAVLNSFKFDELTDVQRTAIANIRPRSVTNNNPALKDLDVINQMKQNREIGLTPDQRANIDNAFHKIQQVTLNGQLDRDVSVLRDSNFDKRSEDQKDFITQIQAGISVYADDLAKGGKVNNDVKENILKAITGNRNLDEDLNSKLVNLTEKYFGRYDTLSQACDPMNDMSPGKRNAILLNNGENNPIKRGLNAIDARASGALDYLRKAPDKIIPKTEVTVLKPFFSAARVATKGLIEVGGQVTKQCANAIRKPIAFAFNAAQMVGHAGAMVYDVAQMGSNVATGKSERNTKKMADLKSHSSKFWRATKDTTKDFGSSVVAGVVVGSIVLTGGGAAVALPVASALASAGAAVGSAAGVPGFLAPAVNGLGSALSAAAPLVTTASTTLGIGTAGIASYVPGGVSMGSAAITGAFAPVTAALAPASVNAGLAVTGSAIASAAVPLEIAAAGVVGGGVGVIAAAALSGKKVKEQAAAVAAANPEVVEGARESLRRASKSSRSQSIRTRASSVESQRQSSIGI